MNNRRWIDTLTRASFAPLVLLFGLLATGTGASAQSFSAECGSVITHDITLANDAGPCPGDGLIVAASGITIDLGGHRIFATQRTNIGIRMENVTNVTVKRGIVDGFDAGVLVVGGVANTVSNMTLQNNRFGLQLENAESSDHHIAKNRVTRNRQIGLWLRRVSLATVKENQVSGNAGYGIVVDGGSAYNTILKNQAFDNGKVGIVARGSILSITSTNLAPPVLDLLSPDRAPYTEGTDYRVMPEVPARSFPHQMAATGRLVPIDIALDPAATSLANPNPADTSTSGCEASDYSAAAFQRGDIALLQRGTCTFDIKIVAALQAGASGVIVFNEGQAPGRTAAEFGAFGIGIPVISNIPVMSASYSVGFELYNLARLEPVVVQLSSTPRTDVTITTPAAHDNVFIRNSATSVLDESCAVVPDNQWIKNVLSQTEPICPDGPPPGGGGATANAF